MAESNIIQDYAEAVLPPVDGGWGWAVVGASLVSNIIVDGIIFTVGEAFQPEWELYYHVNSTAAAWAASLLASFYFLTGIFVAVPMDLWGCRPVVMTGALVAVTGFLISTAARTITVFNITFGVIGGIGLGMIFMPSRVIINYYFEKGRGSVNGLVSAGSGIGTLLFAMIFKYLLLEYNWQGVILITSGIVLNCLVCGAIYRMPEPTKKQLARLKNLYEEKAELVPSPKSIDQFRPPIERVRRGRANTAESIMNGASIRGKKGAEGGLGQQPYSDDPGYYRDNSGKLRRYSHFAIPFSAAGVRRLNRPLFRPGVFLEGSVRNLPEYRAAHQDFGLYIASTTNIEAVIKQQEALAEGRGQVFCATLKAGFCDLLSPAIVKSPSFLLFVLLGFVASLGFFVPYIYLPRYAQQLGMSKDMSANLLLVLGIANAFLRLACGCLSDRPRMNALLLTSIALTVGGIATIFLPWIKHLWAFWIYCIIFGFATGCLASLQTVICVDLLGVQLLHSTFAFFLIGVSIGSFGGSPLAAWLYDRFGTYDVPFYITGAFVTLSGIMGFGVMWLKEWEKRPKPGAGSVCGSGGRASKAIGEEGKQQQLQVEQQPHRVQVAIKGTNGKETEAIGTAT